MRGREKRHETSQGCRAHENRARLRLVASRAAPAPRILLEESDDGIRTALESALHRDGYDVTACREGVTLLDQLFLFSEPSDFDLIIATIQDRALNAVEILEGEPLLPNLPPMVLLTATPNEKLRTVAERLGAALLDKNSDVGDLMAQVHKLVPPAR